MDRIKSVYFQMDADVQTLSDNARAQFLIKSLYTLNKPGRKEEIITVYKNVLGVKNVNEDRLNSIIDELADKDIMKISGSTYSLHRKTIRVIENELEASQNRLNGIIDTYFSGFNTSRDILSDWLVDSMIAFFTSFSNAWMSDLTSKEKAIESKRTDIIKQIYNRTNNNKKVDSRDREELAKRFFGFITDKHPDVTAFLWEYGTSAFSVSLVKETAGADELSLDLFENCSCILDTNILIDIALEGDERHDSLDALSDIFKELNTTVHTLHVTREEYKNKIASKYYEIKRLTYGSLCRALVKAEDQFMRTAGIRGCEDAEDFERFFQTLDPVPEKVGDVEITDFDENEDLCKAIENAQKDEALENEYQSLYMDMHGFSKRPGPLKHDLGLIGAANYLSSTSKVFVLSDDPTLNQYAKRQQYKEIPFSVRLDTLINVLALKRGGMNGRNTSFQNVFANIISNGFAPSSNTFRVEDLSYMYDKNIQVASLSEERVKEIACAINRMRMSDMPEKEVSKALMHYIQGEKIRIQGEYDLMREKYILEHSENEENKKELETANRQAEGLAYKNAKRNYKWIVLKWSIISFFMFFLVIPGIVYLIIRFIPGLNTGDGNITAIVVNVISDVGFETLLVIKLIIPKLFNTLTNKKEIIESLKDKELSSF